MVWNANRPGYNGESWRQCSGSWSSEYFLCGLHTTSPIRAKAAVGWISLRVCSEVLVWMAPVSSVQAQCLALLIIMFLAHRIVAHCSKSLCAEFFKRPIFLLVKYEKRNKIFTGQSNEWSKGIAGLKWLYFFWNIRVTLSNKSRLKDLDEWRRAGGGVESRTAF